MCPALRSYPTYKPSGVPWLGEVPSHWALAPNRSCLYLEKEVVGERAKDYRLLSLTKQGIIARDMENPQGKFPASFESYQVVQPGDLIFCLFDIDETPRAVGLSDIHGMITGAYTRFVCRQEQTRRFIHLVYLSLDNRKLLKPLYSGLRKVITKSAFLSARLALPPLAEQTAIVRYVDHVDRRVRRYVRAKERLTGLLEEEKQAIINQAVTRGLDPSVRLKASGVEWLGDVPEHWEVRRLRTLADIRTGGRDTINRRDDGAYPFFVRSQTVEAIDTWSFDGEAVLTAGDGAGVGKVFHYVDGKFDYHQRVYKFSNFSGIVGRFFFNYFKATLRYEVFQGTAKSTVESLRLPMLQNFPIPLPPPHEQAEIVKFVDEVELELDASIARASRQVELIQEYRTRLIADVVTGKLDVREAAAGLGDEGEDELGDGDGDGVGCRVASRAEEVG